jgi:hypothetical protein
LSMTKKKTRKMVIPTKPWRLNARRERRSIQVNAVEIVRRKLKSCTESAASTVNDEDSDSLDEEDLALLEENMGIKLARNEGVRIVVS